MKTEKKESTKSVIEELRNIRDNISAEIKDMTFEQLKAYLEKKSTLHSHSLWQKETK